MRGHLIVFVVLCGLYSALVPRLPEAPPGGVGAEPERNTIRAERIAYPERELPVVISGSSVSARMEPLIPRDWHDLSFTAGGSRIGLEMLLRVDRKPQLVLLETNTIHMRVDTEPVDALFHPVWHPVRTHVPMMREVNNPAHALLRVLAPPPPPPGEGDPHMGDPDRRPPPEVYQEMLRNRMHALEGELLHVDLDKAIAETLRQVRALTAAGVRVALFEVPEHPMAYETGFKMELRRRLLAAFPPGGEVLWIPDADPREYETTEGVHLTTPSALKFAKYLEAWVAKNR